MTVQLQTTLARLIKMHWHHCSRRRLELPSSVSIGTLDLPKTGNHPASVMVIVRHAGPLSSVFSHKDNGMRGTIYYRPPSEATLIWTPSDKVK